MSAAMLNGRAASVQLPVNGNGQAGHVYDGLVPTINRYLEIKAWQRECESEGRKAEKEARVLETALTDAMDANGGTIDAGPHRLRFELVAGVPGYKGICERHIAPAVLLDEVNATPKRRKLVVE